ncbi:hypothetical protein BU14_3090s0001, partial [Porphyra umbilicalis]
PPLPRAFPSRFLPSAAAAPPRGHRARRAGIVQALERLDSSCVLHLTAANVPQVRLIVKPDALTSVGGYAILDRDHWFESYRIESQNENQIGLQMEVANLTKTLQSALSAQDVLVKLAKKGVPVLTFEITTALGVIMQDVPVYVLTPAHLAACVEPETPTEPGVVLPPLAKMFHVVDRMRPLGHLLGLDVDIQAQATLTLSVEGVNVDIRTSYAGLFRATMETEPTAGSLPQVVAGVHVDVKNFSRALFGHTVTPDHAFCFVFPAFVLVHLPAEGVTLSYFV